MGRDSRNNIMVVEGFTSAQILAVIEGPMTVGTISEEE